MSDITQRAALWSCDHRERKSIKQWLDDHGYEYKIVIGKYHGQIEYSFATWESVMLEAMKVGWLYNQETVILSDGNTATLYEVVRYSLGWDHPRPFDLSTTLKRVQSGIMSWRTAVDEHCDYTYMPEHRKYMTIRWHH